jgi:hypothetical protein
LLYCIKSIKPDQHQYYRTKYHIVDQLYRWNTCSAGAADGKYITRVYRVSNYFFALNEITQQVFVSRSRTFIYCTNIHHITRLLEFYLLH